VFRVAGEADLVALRDLERTANLTALAHVFPPDRYPFPDDAVLARWRLVMDDPAVEVLVRDRPEGSGLLSFIAYDAVSVRHLAVHPLHWGQGLATASLAAAMRDMTHRGATEAGLWVLAENHRARRLYAHLEWLPTDVARAASWPPHPLELEYRRHLAPAT
jgi:GNAT superfamily N-acetyltransferase